MKIKGIGWAGVRTNSFEPMKHFAEQTLGLSAVHESRDFVVYRLPNGDKFEIFGPNLPSRQNSLRATRSCAASAWTILTRPGKSYEPRESSFSVRCIGTAPVDTHGSTFACPMARRSSSRMNRIRGRTLEPPP